MKDNKILRLFLNILKSLGLIALLVLMYTIVLIVFNVDYEKMSLMEDVFYRCLSSLLLMGVLGYVYRKDLKADFLKFKKKPAEIIEMGIKYWVIGLGIMIVSNIIINFILKMGIAGNEEAVRNFIDEAPLFMIFNSVIYAPFTEELIFRKSIRDITSNKWVFAFISGLVFGMLHIMNYVNSYIDLVFIIPYFALGFVFALLYDKTDNIYASMFIHALHNALACGLYIIGGII